MDSKKITMIIVGVILVATAAILGVKLAGKNAEVSSPQQTQTTKPVSSVTKKGADNSSVQSSTSADPDIKALESDLDSVSEEDFGDASLSDAEVGL